MPQLTIVPEYHPTTKDLDREAQMLRLLNACMYSTNRHEQAKLWAEYVGLHESRQAEWVAWDEKRKGLRK